MPPRFRRRTLKLLILIPVSGYLGLMLFAALFANRFIFPVPPAGYRDSPDILKFTYNEGQAAVSMVYLENPASPYLVFYHHGNREDLQSILPRITFLRDAGFSVLAWDYPGYGTSDGKPSQKLIQTVAEMIWQSIPDTFHYPPDKVLLYGRSLGSGPATWLASRHPSGGLILQGGITSAFRIGLGFSILPWDIFDNLDRIGSVQCPVLVLHGTEDRTVPFANGVALYENAPSPKSFAWFYGAGHSDIIDLYPDVYTSSLVRFTEIMHDR